MSYYAKNALARDIVNAWRNALKEHNKPLAATKATELLKVLNIDYTTSNNVHFYWKEGETRFDLWPTTCKLQTTINKKFRLFTDLDIIVRKIQHIQ